MKTIEERAKELARKAVDNRVEFCGEDEADVSYWIDKEVKYFFKDGFMAGYKEALTDNEHLLCEIDNLHNLIFWLRLKNHELIIGEF